MREVPATAILCRLLDAARRPPDTPAWASFDSHVGRYVVGAVFFLLDVVPDGDVETFVLRDTERLLQHLQRRTDRLQVEHRGQVRGHVVWPATYKARHTEDYDPTRLVCREVRNVYDTPENQAVKYVLNCIEGCLSVVPSVLQAGICYVCPPAPPSATLADAVPAPAGRVRRSIERLDNLDAAMQRYRRNVYLRGVSLPDRLTDEHLRRVDAQKLPEYRAVLRVARGHRRLCRARSGAALQQEVRDVAQRVIPLPGGGGDAAARWMALAADLLRTQIVGEAGEDRSDRAPLDRYGRRGPATARVVEATVRA
jgi:hypothetical protein